MNATLPVINLVTLGVAIAAAVMTPTISRPTVPLGVSVPSTRAGDPVVLAAIRRYRVWCLVSGALAAVGILLTLRWPLWQSSWVLAYVAAVSVAFVLCRRPIQRAKAAGKWYAGSTVRVSAPVTQQPPAAGVAWPVHLLSLAIALVGVIGLALAYPSLPDPFPVHFGDDGRPNRFVPKTWGSVLSLPLFALGMALFLLATCWLVARHRDPQLPDGDAATARRTTAGTLRLVQLGLAWTSVACSLLTTALAITQMGPVAPAVRSGLVLGGVAATMLPTVWLLVRAAQLQRKRGSLETVGAESPDDDARWKLGLFYVNSEDPRAFVPKRSGVGLDVNYGSPGGLVFLAGMLVLFVGCIAAAVIKAH